MAKGEPLPQEYIDAIFKVQMTILDMKEAVEELKPLVHPMDESLFHLLDAQANAMGLVSNVFTQVAADPPEED